MASYRQVIPGRGRQSVLAATLFVVVATACVADTTNNSPSSSARAPSPVPSATGSSEASPSPEPTEAPSPTPDEGAWTLTSFDEDGMTEFVTSVTAWEGGFAAIGHRYEGEALIDVVANEPLVWTSADGRAWQEAEAEFEPAAVELVGVAPLADGGLLTVARSGEAWSSSDAATWEPVDLPLGAQAMISSFAHGPGGYVLSAGRDLWFSPDGLAWTLAHTIPGEGSVRAVVAGDEGFVAIGHEAADGSVAVTVASGDGRSWHRAGTGPERGFMEVAGLGADWIGLAYDESIHVWSSENGLEWQQTVDVNDLTGPGGPKAGNGMESEITAASIAATAGRAVLTLTWNHCCGQLPRNVGSYVSTDGRQWTDAALGNGFVRSIATDGETLVLAGHLGRGEAAAFWAGTR